MPSTAVYFVSPRLIASIAACLMLSGVSKSGSPAPRPMTSKPAAFSSRALLLQTEANQLAGLKAPHDTNQRIAILALVLALLSAVAFLLWRYHRRDYASPRRIGRRI